MKEVDVIVTLGAGSLTDGAKVVVFVSSFSFGDIGEGVGCWEGAAGYLQSHDSHFFSNSKVRAQFMGEFKMAPCLFNHNLLPRCLHK